MTTKRTRTLNFTYDEKLRLCNLVAKYKHITECKKTDAASMREKDGVWLKLTDIFNLFNSSTRIDRSAESLKTCWENIKKKFRKEAGAFKTNGLNDAVMEKVRTIMMPSKDAPANPLENDAQFITEQGIQANRLLVFDGINDMVIKKEQVDVIKDEELEIKFPDDRLNHVSDNSENVLAWDGSKWATQTAVAPDSSVAPEQAAVPSRVRWQNRRRLRHPKTIQERLAEAKLNLTLLSQQHTERELEIVNIKRERELNLLEISKIELKRKRIEFERDFGSIE